MLKKKECQPRILIVSLSASEPSVGRRCVPTIVAALDKAGAAAVHRDIRDLPPVWVDKRKLKEFPPAYAELYAEMEASDGVMLVVPIYCYTMSGAAKSVIEIIGDALTMKPVAIVTAAGSHRSHLAIRDLMASMMFEQDTICFPKTVQATEEMLTRKKDKPNKELEERLTALATKFVAFAVALKPFVVEHGGNDDEE